MRNPFFFGYGSLVNRQTHAFDNAHPASVRGWRRAWRRSPLRDLSFLTVIPDAGTELLGLIAEVPGADWAALDERESAYARNHVSPHVTHDLTGELDIAIYAIPDGHHDRPEAENPVLLSYIDTVVQGFMAEYGAGGAAHFFDTTDGWDAAPVLNDRAAPVYSRHRTTETAMAVVDDHLARVRAKIVLP